MSHKSKTICKFLVRLELPTGSNSNSAQQYIRSALSSYKGGLEASDPMFNLDSERMTVALVEKTTAYTTGSR